MSESALTRQYQQALAQFSRGQWEFAGRSCQQLLQAEPRHGGALHLLGLLALRGGDAERALALLDQSIAVDPAQPDVHFNRGVALLRLARPHDALECFGTALRLKPDYAEAVQLRGQIRLEQAQVEEALADYVLASRLRPDLASNHVNRGNALFRLGRTEAALAAYDTALALNPHDAATSFNRGHALLELNRYPEALDAYQAVSRLNPAFAKVHLYCGIALRRLLRPIEALASFDRACTADPRSADAHCGLGNALRDLGRWDEALNAYERALALDAGCLEALSNRARVLLTLNRPLEAEANLQRLFTLAPRRAPDLNFALGNWLHSRLLSCDWRDFDALVRDIHVGVAADQRVTLPPLFVAISDSPEAQLRCAQNFVADNWGADGYGPWTAATYAHSRIRVAYVSSDFREHPVAQLMAGIFEQHDRDRFEIVGVALRQSDGSDLAGRVRRAFDRVVEGAGVSDAELCAAMRSMEIDIAVDLNGYTDGFRPEIFARRAAPVQVAYLGYPGTLAANYIDYLIADHTVIPDAERRHYAEKIAFLPGCYQPNDSLRPIAETPVDRADHGLPREGIVFCCFNNQYKILPPVFDVWMRLLLALDGSVLWLSSKSEAVMENLRREARARGVDPDRLVFARRLPQLSDHLARYRLADLFLDTIPFNAHTTASDALWAGLPVLTCLGRTFSGRVAASLLRALGLPELVTETLLDYERQALDLVRSPRVLAALRIGLKAARTSRGVFDTARLCRNIESAFQYMQERRVKGLSPEDFDVHAG